MDCKQILKGNIKGEYRMLPAYSSVSIIKQGRPFSSLYPSLNREVMDRKEKFTEEREQT